MFLDKYKKEKRKTNSGVGSIVFELKQNQKTFFLNLEKLTKLNLNS